MAQWFYKQNGQQYGPIDAAALKRMAIDGELEPSDLIWREGLPEWVAASQAKGLFPAAGGPMAPAAITRGVELPVSTVLPKQSAPSVAPARQRIIESMPQRESEETNRMSANEKKFLVGGIGIAVVIAAVFLTWFFGLRDTWEADHRAEVLHLSEEAVNFIHARKPAEGVKKFDELLQLVGNRKLNDADLTKAIAGARDTAEPAKQKIQEERRLAEILGTVRNLQTQANVFVSAGEWRPGIDKYQQALDLIRQAGTSSPEMAAAITQITNAKKTAEARLQTVQRKQEEEEQAKGELLRRVDTYPKYEEKTQPFLDAIIRTQSDLEVGINNGDFGSRVQDMNFRYNKWVAALSPAEKTYPSALMLERVLNSYTRSQKRWSAKLGKHPEYYRPYYYSDSMRQFEWTVAGSCLKLTTRMMGQKDIFESTECPGCGGKGTLTCPHCEGKKLCPTCGGHSTKENGPSCCNGDNRCQVCLGTGTVQCPMCGGTKKTPGK